MPLHDPQKYRTWSEYPASLYLRAVRTLWLILPLGLIAQDKPAYLLYSSKGKPLSYKQVLTQMARADVVLFGETHNNPIAHWLAYELVRDLASRYPDSLLVGMEMFETDQQEVLLRYLQGQIPTLDKLAEAIPLWPNFRTDYAPLVEFCRSRKIPLYATNAPRALARAVGQKGLSALEGLPPEQRRNIAPLPFPRLDTLRCYQQMDSLAQSHGMNPEPFRLAQMLKDATMAHRIAQAWRPGTHFFHLHGRYHSDYHEGIAAYLRLYNPALKVLVLTTEEVPDPTQYKPAQPPAADVFLVVPETMTRTH